MVAMLPPYMGNFLFGRGYSIPLFDIVLEIDMQEVRNMVENTNRELSTY